jgi:signal transduction histidine kinase
MPALAKAPARLPRFVPHIHPGADAGAGSFSNPESIHGPHHDPHQESRPALNAPAIAPPAESLDRLAHDARNILSGLMLYCDLLSAPGVLASRHNHYAQELQSIAKSAAQIMERMAAAQPSAIEPPALPAASPTPLPAVPVTDAADELRHLQPLLAAIAGHAIQLSVATMPCPGRTALASEDLTRILINLVRNAADAMPAGGRIRITAQYGDGLGFAAARQAAECATEFVPRSVLISVSDNGPGIPAELREQVFDIGFTTRESAPHWPTPRRRGTGLSIVRNLIEAAGGTVRIAPVQPHGARFEISLPLTVAMEKPITSGTCAKPLTSPFADDSPVKGCIECQ